MENPDPGDQSAPSILVTVSWERPGTPDAGSLELSSTDERRTFHRDTVVRLQALASDPESGVASVRIEGHVTRTCDVGGDLAEEKRAAVLVRQPAPPAEAAPGALGAGFTAGIDYVKCVGRVPTLSARGDLKVVAANGAGLQVTSRSFRWDWRIP